nr:MAG TPA: hypothetical protein [Caudoviricetes sp.]
MLLYNYRKGNSLDGTRTVVLPRFCSVCTRTPTGIVTVNLSLSIYYTDVQPFRMG